LRVLDDFRSLRHFDAGRAVHASRHHRLVHPGHHVEGWCVESRHDLLDLRKGVFFVAGVDALRAVPHREVLAAAQAGVLLQERNAIFFGSAWIDGRFVHDDVAALQHPAQCFGCAQERGQIGLMRVVDGRGHRDDVEVCITECARLAREDYVRLRQVFMSDLARVVMALAQGFDSLRIGIESDGARGFPERDGHRKADVAEPDHCDVSTMRCHAYQSSMRW
jgi:hypothetical protein